MKTQIIRLIRLSFVLLMVGIFTLVSYEDESVSFIDIKKEENLPEITCYPVVEANQSVAFLTKLNNGLNN